MQIEITTVVVIDCDTGQTTSRSTWRCKGGEVGLGPQLLQAAAALGRAGKPEPLPSDSLVTPGDDERGSTPSRVRGLAYLVGVTTESTDQAAAKLGTGRVLEILEWMVAKRKKQPIKVPERLFWSLCDKPSE